MLFLYHIMDVGSGQPLKLKKTFVLFSPFWHIFNIADIILFYKAE